jgi:hypothetical protein
VVGVVKVVGVVGVVGVDVRPDASILQCMHLEHLKRLRQCEQPALCKRRTALAPRRGKEGGVRVGWGAGKGGANGISAPSLHSLTRPYH